ncbi:MAG: Uma2 family endonuclease [Sciscionella sp.]
MSVALAGATMTWDDVLRTWRELAVLEGWRPELTSQGSARHERKKKKWAYAHGGIPQYLLIGRYDEDGPTVSLFTDPAKGAYRQAIRVAFGQPITLDEPFGIELDTNAF